MAAQFPTNIRQFTPKVDLQDTILADHINVLQDEVRAVQLALNGTTNATNGMLSSTYSGVFAATTSWTSLDDRITNIEAGLVNGVSTSPYVKKAGDSIQPASGTIGLILKATGGTAALFEARSSTNALGFNIDVTGTPKVGTANVVYVGSTEYTTVQTTADQALAAANAVRFDPFLLAGM